MDLIRRAEGTPARLGVLPGAFNPPTRAHIALARSALAHLDEVLFVIPHAFPHKVYEGASFEQRIEMLLRAVDDEPAFSVGASAGGLFIEIARECRAVYGPGVKLWFLCGADAAERIVNWDYGPSGPIDDQLREYGLMVAPRKTPYVPPERLRARVRSLALDAVYNELSATEVRARIHEGRPWEHLVPEAVVPMVRAIYA